MRLLYKSILLALVISIMVSLVSISHPFNNKITPYQIDQPNGFPSMQFPEGNELTKERITLGRYLFYDPILSVDSTISCAHCHQQRFAFADNQIITPGVEGRLAMRNAPTLTNVGYNPTLLFDGFLNTLEKQVGVPIQEHAEFAHNIVDISKQLKKQPLYLKMSYDAYERPPDPYVITRSIASFERILISGNSKYDQAKRGDIKLTKSEERGQILFEKKLHCTNCHGGFNFTSFDVKNNGLREHYEDNGRRRATKKQTDDALFKIPTLRNIELTAPYMHNGGIATLEEVILHYESGGANHINKDTIIQPFKLSKRQRNDLISFLKTLTDTSFIGNPNFSSPFK